jgi:hypothetical protein
MAIMLAKTYAAFENRLTKIEGDLILLKWMLGIVTGGVAGLYALVGPGIWLLARIAPKIGALG